jgi:hypothetical protein
LLKKTGAPDSGQAVVEYILLLSAIVAIYVTIISWVNSFGLMQKLVTPLTRDYAKTYQFGDPKADGFDGEPKRHPRISGCEECFRLFINPEIR